MIALGLMDPPLGYVAPGSKPVGAPAAQPDEGDAPEGSADQADEGVARQSSGPGTAGFVEPVWFNRLAFATRHRKGACMFGGRGGGKSTAIRELAKREGRSTVPLQCSANMQIDSLIGTWTAKDGGTVFIDGPLAIAMRQGLWLLAEEANAVHPGVWSAVNTLTDDTGEGLRLPTGEVIPPHPDFRLILLYNDGYVGTKEVNGALKDRLPPIYCPYPPRDQEIAILQNKTGAPNQVCAWAVDLATMIRQANLRFDLSVRALANMIDFKFKGGATMEEAFEFAILDLIGPPETTQPQRAVLAEIARQCGLTIP